MFIKEVAEATSSNEVIIVTSSLIKDMNSNTELYRGNAIRVLSKILDGPMLGQIDRYIKQAIVDRNALVSSSALVSGLHLMRANPDVVRRWVNEVQTAVTSEESMVQFHALGLLYAIKQHDKQAVSKMVSQLSRTPLRSPLAVILLIRYTTGLLGGGDVPAATARASYEFLERCLNHRSDMVIYEAARAICALPQVAARDLAPAINVLHLFLSSPKPALKFAAVRCLNQVSMIHPDVVAKCNDELERLISDSNRSIATLATTTLLKTGSESGIERLMKQIGSFMAEIADEFKVVVVHAIRELCLKYPAKHSVLMAFLSTTLREEGGHEFKSAIVETLMEVMTRLPATRDAGLFHLCEFIEDCEFVELSCSVLSYIAQEGPSAKSPSRYIRFIYNRVLLESPGVRAAAVSALARFGAALPTLRRSVSALLQRAQRDEDDEVRDRATTALLQLAELGDRPLLPPTEDGSPASGVELSNAAGRAMLIAPLDVSVRALERALETYRLRPSAGPLSLSALPIVEEGGAGVRGSALDTP